jgi:hypothetical protein
LDWESYLLLDARDVFHQRLAADDQTPALATDTKHSVSNPTIKRSLAATTQQFASLIDADETVATESVAVLPISVVHGVVNNRQTCHLLCSLSLVGLRLASTAMVDFYHISSDCRAFIFIEKRRAKRTFQDHARQGCFMQENAKTILEKFPRMSVAKCLERRA